ncbi:MAG: hypothetical protein HND54_01700 [Bacteroidetes bacterium]|nr:hypothetical protein [Flavobacteriales bacterium]NOG56429.1 hypothetical protein [Bacteroidota bacterium]
MKHISFLTLFLLSLVYAQAQPEDKKLGKITFLMVDGKFEDAAFKSQKLIEDPEYRKSGWAWYYLAQANFEIAKKPELQEDYPKAMKDALKAAYKLDKYKNKPAENMAVYDEAKEFLAKLKDSTITISEIYYDNNDARKAAYYLKSITKFDEDDYAVWLMKGVYEIKSRNVGEGVKSIMLAMENLSLDYVPDPESAQTLVDALDEFALIVKSGEYDKYFASYKYEPTQKDIDDALVMKEKMKEYIKGKEVNIEARKKESETIFKSFRSDDVEEEEDDE